MPFYVMSCQWLIQMAPSVYSSLEQVLYVFLNKTRSVARYDSMGVGETPPRNIDVKSFIE
jgi:hypothetical protein